MRILRMPPPPLKTNSIRHWRIERNGYTLFAPANTDVATYRLLGRTYFLELRYRLE